MAGSREEHCAKVRQARDAIRHHVQELIEQNA